MSTIDELKKLAPVELPGATWAALERAYANPPRAYHTLEHVLEVARLWAKESWKQPRETFLAVLFHDAVYVVGNSDNEQKSADLSGDDPRVRELILLTARHGRLAPKDVDDEAAKFLDCDMAILGASPEEFARYEEQIAQEYVPVLGEDAYASGRRRFVQRLLAKERIFLSEAFHARLDARARENLRSALR
jgi:predicted metal-dependent HD superfamily phosphohydrolase